MWLQIGSPPRAPIAADLSAAPGILACVDGKKDAFAQQGFPRAKLVDDTAALTARAAAVLPGRSLAALYTPAEVAFVPACRAEYQRAARAVKKALPGKANQPARKAVGLDANRATGSPEKLQSAITIFTTGMRAHPEIAPAAMLADANIASLEERAAALSAMATRVHAARAARSGAVAARRTAQLTLEHDFSLFEAAAEIVFQDDPDGLQAARLLVPRRKAHARKAAPVAASTPDAMPAPATPPAGLAHPAA